MIPDEMLKLTLERKVLVVLGTRIPHSMFHHYFSSKARIDAH